MIVKATSTSRKTDVRDQCGKIELRPANVDESLFLAMLYNVLISGGKITISPSSKAKKLNKYVKGRFVYQVPV